MTSVEQAGTRWTRSSVADMDLCLGLRLINLKETVGWMAQEKVADMPRPTC